jgi:hypothetical protein
MGFRKGNEDGAVIISSITSFARSETFAARNENNSTGRRRANAKVGAPPGEKKRRRNEPPALVEFSK